MRIIKLYVTLIHNSPQMTEYRKSWASTHATDVVWGSLEVVVHGTVIEENDPRVVKVRHIIGR